MLLVSSLISLNSFGDDDDSDESGKLTLQRSCLG